MIRFLMDALLLVSVSAAAWVREPFLGVIFFGVSISYVAQYWRMIHLLGWEELRPDRKRMVMAAVLALVFGSGGFLLIGQGVPVSNGASVQRLWQEEFIPIWIGMGFFAALTLIYLTNERKRR